MQGRVYRTVAIALTILAAIGMPASAEQSAAPGSASTVTGQGALVMLTDCSVTATFPGFFYVETHDRCSGIRVDIENSGVVTGNTVSLMGTMARDFAGEFFIRNANVIVTGTDSPTMRPLGVRNIDLPGYSWRWVSTDDQWQYVWMLNPGLVTTGLLVKVWGCVTYVDPAGSYFYLDDGTNLKEYSQTRAGVRV